MRMIIMMSCMDKLTACRLALVLLAAALRPTYSLVLVTTQYFNPDKKQRSVAAAAAL